MPRYRCAHVDSSEVTNGQSVDAGVGRTGKELCVLNLGEEMLRKRGWTCTLLHFPSEMGSLYEFFSRVRTPGKVEAHAN